MKLDHSDPSSQAKGSKSTSFLTHVRNEVDLVLLACEDDSDLDNNFGVKGLAILTHIMKVICSYSNV